MIKIVLFYSIAACVIGAVFTSFEKVTVSWRGKPVQFRFQRLVGGIIAGALWPVTLFQTLFGKIR